MAGPTKEGALFSVPLADLDYGEREIDEEIPTAWLAKALEGSEAVARAQPGRLTVTLSKSGREVMVRGQARAGVTMPCARTLDPVDFDVSADIFLLLSPGAPAPRAAKDDGKKAAPRKAGGKPARKKREEEAPLPEDETARDTYDGERITLDPFVREFLLLELPMVPLREDLRSEATPAIERPLEPVHEDRPTHGALNPRLAPLAAIASRLRAKKE